MPKSKFFRVAVEGATCDGRTLERQHIEQMAKRFNPALYGARVNLEHWRSASPNSDFRAYGDVIAVKAEEVTEEPLKGKLGLYVQVDATDDLVALKKSRQKIYHSIEVHPSFADTGEAYLMGLACTDSPASLGTEMMEFCAKSTVNPLASRKHDQACFFTASVESTMEFEDEQPPQDEGKNFFARIKALLGGTQQQFNQQNGENREAIEAIAESQGKLLDSTTQLSAAVKGKADATELESLRKDFKALEEKLKGQDAEQYNQRPTATGGDGQSTQHLADC
ncbi:TPA: GPO family capsid scaffolding protein [Klebsiella pneumoniae]|nr:GPO family capsid scaffolding protein [Klebsiella pneumoniae]